MMNTAHYTAILAAKAYIYERPEQDVISQERTYVWDDVTRGRHMLFAYIPRLIILWNHLGFSSLSLSADVISAARVTKPRN